MIYLGELAALGTASCWSVGSMFFDAAGRQIGPNNVNRIRIVLAAVLLSVALWVSTGRFVPGDIPFSRLFWLSLSGLIGLVLGDACFFTSLVILGPRRATLLMSSAPVITALFAWPVLGEVLSLTAITGIGITTAGIVWVSSEKRGTVRVERSGSLITGALWGLGGAAGQAIGLVLAKLGLGQEVTPLEGTFCRMVAAAAFIWLFTLISGRLMTTLRALNNWRGLAHSLGGAFVGPFIGVWLSLVAVKHTEAGIAATIMAAVPVLVILLEIAVHRERPTFRAALGALITVGGIGILFLR
jgi:drug/metabolite transporter (DMT)-like permease